MKRIMKLISLVVTFSMIMVTSVFAEDINPNQISMNYTIVAEDGTVVRTGTMNGSYTPGPSPRYSWDDDITLVNGEGVIFSPSNEYRGLYATAGTKMKISYSLNRSAKHDARVRAYVAGPDSEYLRLGVTDSGVSNASFTTSETDYYYGMLTNLSSDAITVKSFSITF